MSSHVKHLALWAVLVALYCAVFAGMPAVTERGTRVDALDPPSHAVERAIDERRFLDALPLAMELQHLHPVDPLTAYWVATIYRGLNRPGDEAAQWETFIRLSSAPEEACPAIGDAYDRLGNQAESLRAFERCVDFDPREPERLIDLGRAWERAGDVERALAAYHRAALLEPAHPVSRGRIQTLARQEAEGR